MFVKDEDFSYVDSTGSTSQVRLAKNPKRWGKVPASDKHKSLEKYNSVDISAEEDYPTHDVQLTQVKNPLFDLADPEDGTAESKSDPDADFVGSVERQESSPSDITRRSIDGASRTGSEASQDPNNRTVLPVYTDSGLELDQSPQDSGFILPIGNAEYAAPIRYTSFA